MNTGSELVAENARLKRDNAELSNLMRLQREEVRRVRCERDAAVAKIEAANVALGNHPDSNTDFTAEIARIRDEGRGHFHTVTEQGAELARLRARVVELERENMNYSEDFAMLGLPPESVMTKLLVTSDERQKATARAEKAEAERDALRLLLAECADATGNSGGVRPSDKVDDLKFVPEAVRSNLANLRARVAELELHKNAAGFCVQHKPTGGYRNCVICGIESLSAAISQIAHICEDKPEVTAYDVNCDERAVVELVRLLHSRFEWLLAHGYHAETEAGRINLSKPKAEVIAKIDEALKPPEASP